MRLPIGVVDLSLADGELFEFSHFRLEYALEVNVLEMKLDLPHAVLEDDDDAHARIAGIDGSDNGGVVSALHVHPIDRKDDVTFPHPRCCCSAVCLHVVHIRYHFDFLFL